LDFIKPTKLLSNMQLCEKYIVQLLGLSFLQQPVSPKVCYFSIPIPHSIFFLLQSFEKKHIATFDKNMLTTCMEHWIGTTI